MPSIARLLLALSLSCIVLTLAPARAAAPEEWNPVRTHSVQLGPEAGRLVVGFRATPGNAVVKSVQGRSLTQSINILQAKTSDADVAGLALRTGLSMAHSRQVTPSMHVLFLQQTLYGAEVQALLSKLRADPSVEFADVDQRRYPHAAPDDPLFGPPSDVATTNTSARSGQWFMETPSSMTTIVNGTPTQDLSATDAISAWAITTGSTGTIIADVDTGVRFDHPDLLRAGFGGRLLPGYDFVDQDYSRTAPYQALGTFLYANDGDGWDPDPSDPGDWVSVSDLNNPLFPKGQCGDPNNSDGHVDSSWHGTRVMGLLGALTHNGVGIAGMTWNPYLLPVRALGKCGGYDSDIVAGMQWAAGLPVTDPSGNPVPDNPYPADIINLSLGGASACDSTSLYRPVISNLTKMGVLIVASAGNGGSTVDTPANCPGVLAVAGLRNVGTKVGYSSFGPEVGISAPAGNCINSSGPCLRSIDTTYNTGLDVPSVNSYTDQINSNLGTSFSAPIVAGIAALMRAVNANLTPPQIIERMKASASPFPPNNTGLPVCPNVGSSSGPNPGECSCGPVANQPTQCGAGMVNALSAVTAALKPIVVITARSNTTFDASASVAACNTIITPNAPLSVASYAWSASGGVAILGAANMPQVSVMSTGSIGTLTVTVTDSASHQETGTVSFTAAGTPTVNTPLSAGTAATACPTPLTVTPMAPTITEVFSPASVSTNAVSTLTITFNNSNGFALTQAGFTETVPANLSVQTSPAPTTTCSGASGTLTSSASAVTMAGANIPAKGSCSMTLSVMSATAGSYTNTIAAHALSTGPAPSSAGTASASLTVTASGSPTATAPSKSGGGALDWFDMMFVVGVLLAGRRYVHRPSPRP